MPACNAQTPVDSKIGGMPVIKGITGYGLDSKGGSGGSILKVTNLNKSGQGSLSEALSHKGPRIIVFEVAGIIDLERESLNIIEPYVTIAGQTAPSPGITLIQGGINIATHDVIIQHLKVRPGEAGHEKKSGWEVDGIATTRGAFNIIVDHCSLTWATDENLSASGPRFEGNSPEEWRKNTSHKILFSHCIIAEGLSNSTHSKGEHSKGSLIHDNVTEILIIGNLFAHNVQRNPFFKGGAQGLVINNYIYNPGNAAIHFTVGPDWAGREIIMGQMLVQGNIIEAGANTRSNIPYGRFNGTMELFWDDNLSLSESINTEITGNYILLESTPFWPEGLVVLPAGDVREWVLKNAGAFPWDRDEVDKRIIEDIKLGKGHVIDSEKDVGGYPNFKPVFRKFKPKDWDLNSMTQK